MLKPVRIGDFLHRHKEAVKIQPDTEYSLVTVKLHHNGVVLREKKRGALLGSNMYRVKKGQFILSGIDARNGAFGIVPEELDGAIITNDFWCFDVDEAKVKRDFFYWLSNTSLFLDACQKASKGETQRIRLQRVLFENIEFQFPPIAEQEAFLNRIAIYDTQLSSLDGEQQKQVDYLKYLRQSILQESIEGKLTAGWRKKHPFCAGDPERDGATILEKIREDKKKLVAEGKIRKEKAIAPIAAGEEPFGLPVGWVWTRLGEIVRVLSDGTHFTPSYISEGVPFLSVKDISNGYIDFSRCRFISSKEHKQLSIRCPVEYGDILLTKVGTTGIAKWVDTEREFSIFVSIALLKINSKLLSSKYFQNSLNSPLIQKLSKEGTWGVGNKNLVLKTITNFTFPLPPLAEQAAIVERVESLLAHVEELEKEVAARKGQTEELMREVLREAFE